MVDIGFSEPGTVLSHLSFFFSAYTEKGIAALPVRLTSAT